MRRMITNKQVVDIVNKAIESGEIEAGGVSLYKHRVITYGGDSEMGYNGYRFVIVTTSSTAIDNATALNDALENNIVLSIDACENSSSPSTEADWTMLDGGQFAGKVQYDDSLILMRSFPTYDPEEGTGGIEAEQFYFDSSFVDFVSNY